MGRDREDRGCGPLDVVVGEEGARPGGRAETVRGPDARDLIHGLLLW